MSLPRLTLFSIGFILICFSLNGQVRLYPDSLKGIDSLTTQNCIIKVEKSDSSKTNLVHVLGSDSSTINQISSDSSKLCVDTVNYKRVGGSNNSTLQLKSLVEDQVYSSQKDSTVSQESKLAGDSLKMNELPAPSSLNLEPTKLAPSEVTYLKQLNFSRGTIIDSSYLETLYQRDGLVDIFTLDSLILVDLRYSDTANFMHFNIYDGLQRAYLTCETAWRLAAAQYYLNKLCMGCRIVVLDATRPLHIQQMMWDSLKMKEGLKHFFLASPDARSLHNYGRAVDVTIVDSSGWMLDMGTDFDAFVAKSAPEYESIFIQKGLLSATQIRNRILLRRVMRLAGFRPIKSEWWHFNFGTIQEARQKHPVIK